MPILLTHRPEFPMRLLPALARGVALPAATIGLAAAAVLPLAASAAELEPSPAGPSSPAVSAESSPVLEPQPEPTEEPTEPTPTEPVEVPASEATPEAPAPLEPLAGPSCTGGALGTAQGAGAVNPVDGRRYLADVVRPGVLGLSVLDPATGDVSAPVTRVRLPDAAIDAAVDAAVGGGGIAFDALGRLYAVTASAPSDGAPGVARLSRTAAPLAERNRPAVLVSETAADREVARIAFDTDGYLHLADTGGSSRVDPTSGEVVAVWTPEQGAAAPCGRPSLLTAGVEEPGFDVAISGEPLTEAVVLPGVAYDVSLTGADLAAYDASYACVDAKGRTLAEGDGTAVRLTMPTAAFGALVDCAFTAVPSAVPPRGEPAAGDDERREPSQVLQVRSLRSEQTDGSRSGLGAGLPGGLGGWGGVRGQDRPGPNDPVLDPTEDADPASGRTPTDGIDLDGGMFGLSDGGRGKMPEAAGDRRRGKGPLDPVLPNTGGPSALAIPVGLGACIAGAVLLTRRRRTA